MYFFGTLCCESANLLLLCTIDNPQDIIINMIGFMIIAQIQDIYSKGSENTLLKSKVHLVEFETRDRSIQDKDKRFTLIDYIIYIVYKLIRIYYVCFYYYFMPFAVVFLTFLVTNYKELMPLFDEDFGKNPDQQPTPTPSPT